MLWTTGTGKAGATGIVTLGGAIRGRGKVGRGNNGIAGSVTVTDPAGPVIVTLLHHRPLLTFTLFL